MSVDQSIDRREQLAKEIAAGNYEKEQGLLSGAIHDIVVFKVIFNHSKWNADIYFLVLFKKHGSEPLELISLARSNQAGTKLSAGSSWDNYIRGIYKSYSNKEGIYDLMGQANTVLKNAFNYATIPSLFTYAEDQEKHQLLNEMENILSHAFGVDEPKMVVEFEMINELDYQCLKLEVDKEETEEKKKESKKEVNPNDLIKDIQNEKKHVVFLDGDVRLSPTKGHSVTSFEPGDSIYVRVQPSGAMEKSILTKAKAWDPDTGKVEDMEAFISDIKLAAKNLYEIVIEIKDPYFIKTQVEGNVLLSAPTPPASLEKKNNEAMHKSRLRFYFILGIGLVAIMVLVTILLT